MSKIQTSVLLSDLKSRTEFCIREAKALLKKNEAVLNNKPNSNTWSPLQCFDHLNQYGDYYLPEINKAIASAESKPSDPFFSTGFIGNMFAKAMLPKKGTTKMQSPKDKEPSTSELDKSVINEFLNQQKKYLELIKISENVNLNRTKVNVTISKFVKIRLGDALRVTIYHNERHVLQALNGIKKS